jgi:hypothetical protein
MFKDRDGGKVGGVDHFCPRLWCGDGWETQGRSGRRSSEDDVILEAISLRLMTSSIRSEGRWVGSGSRGRSSGRR